MTIRSRKLKAKHDWGFALMGMMIRRTFLVAFMLLAVAPAEAQTRNDAEAIRLNNRGVAQMGQQFTERAESSLPKP